MNRSVLDIKGEILLISQFTLYANCQRGRRPDFIQAASPEVAEKLYLEFAENLTNKGIKPKLGIFAAHMNIALENNGPVTILLEKEKNREGEKMKLIASCGLICNQCPAYIATHKNDRKLREETAEKVVSYVQCGDKSGRYSL